MSKQKIKIAKATRFDYTIQSFQDEEISIVENPAFYREYDEDGNMTLEIIYGPGGYLSEKYAFVYKNGKMIEQIVYMDEDTIAEHQFIKYQEDKLFEQITKYQEGEDITKWTFDNEGRIISKITYDEDEEGEKLLYTYENNTVRKQIYDSGELEIDEVEILDDKGRVTENRTINNVEENYVITTYEYSPKDEVLIEIQKTEEGKLIQKIENEFDANGKQTTMKITTPDSFSLTKFEYDEAGNEIYQVETNEQGEVNHQVQRSFDHEGNLLESSVELHYHGQGMDARYEIKYDYSFFEENQ